MRLIAAGVVLLLLVGLLVLSPAGFDKARDAARVSIRQDLAGPGRPALPTLEQWKALGLAVYRGKGLVHSWQLLKPAER